MAKVEDLYQCQTMDCGYVYDPDMGIREEKSQQVLHLMICTMTDVVQVAALERKYFVPLQELEACWRSRAERSFLQRNVAQFYC